MRIAIDISLINQDNAGINQYTREILRELVINGEHEFLLFARKQEQLPFELPINAKLFVLPAQSKWLGGWYRALASKLRTQKVDLLLTFTLTSAPIFYRKTVTFVHDISPLTQKQYASWWQTEKYRLLLKITMLLAKQILTISQSTADQLHQMFPRFKSEIEVIYPGLAKRFTSEISATAIAEFKQSHAISDKFVLSIGTIQPRKNYLVAVKSFHQFLQRNGKAVSWNYVIAGKFGWDYQEVINYIHAHKLEDKIKILTRLSDMEMVVALRGARGFLQLSLDEGFGMPLVEAAASGLPILASNIPVFREIDLPNTIYVDPNDVPLVARELNNLVEMPDGGVNQKIAEVFSWESSADKLLETIKPKRQ